MRLSLPERISTQWALVFAVVLLFIQMLEGTDLSFAVMHFTFLMMWVYTFNLAGGFTRASGAYVFWFGLLTVLVGTVTKVAYGERPDSNLNAPVLTMAVYTVSMAVLLLSVAISRKVTLNTASIAGRLRSYDLDYRNASIGCSIVGLSLPFVLGALPSGPGTVFGAVRQLNFLAELGVILGTISTIQTSQGRRAWSLLNGIPAAASFLIGFATFSKQAMFTSTVCWVIGIAYMRYRLGLGLMLAFVIWVTLCLTVFTPIAQVGRDAEAANNSWADGFGIAVDLLVHIKETRMVYAGASKAALEASGGYFSHDVSLLSRFTRLESDDALISYSAQGHYIGYASVWYSFLNWFPHLLFPDKEKYAPVEMGGNYYAREMGLLPATDTTTGISFGSAAEAFHFDGWQSLILVQLLVWVLLLMSSDLLCGDIRRSPWGLFFAVIFSHVAPESGIGSAIQFIWAGNLSLFLCMVFSTYAAPIIGSAFTSSSRRRAGGNATQVLQTRSATT